MSTPQTEMLDTLRGYLNQYEQKRRERLLDIESLENEVNDIENVIEGLESAIESLEEI